MGRTTVKARIENSADAYQAAIGGLSPDKVRAIEVEQALVDSGAKLLGLPKSMIDQLGLAFVQTRPALTAAGEVTAGIYSSVILSVQGRRCTVDVSQIAEGCPVLIGYLPLEGLEFILDPLHQRLIPAELAGGPHLLDLY
jgi:predicted aspartyl protease